MSKAYVNYLPRDYFGGLYGKVVDKIQKGQNILLSVMHGGGGRTFLQMFLHYADKDNLNQEISVYDPEIQEKDISAFVVDRSNDRGSLFIIRSFDKFENKSEILEKLNSIQHTTLNKITFLFETSHDGIVNSEEYFGASTQFFQERYYIGPFDKNETRRMMEINDDYYGWEKIYKDPEKVFELSGGIPRLIKHICKEISENEADTDSYNKFFHNPSIKFQLDYLSKLLINHTGELKDLGLINDQGNIKSKILQKYFNVYRSDFIKDLYIELSDLELQLFTYLYEKDSGLVSLEELGEIFEKSGHEFSPWAIYKHISRIRPKIEDKFIIKNYKGRGYQLVSKN